MQYVHENRMTPGKDRLHNVYVTYQNKNTFYTKSILLKKVTKTDLTSLPPWSCGCQTKDCRLWQWDICLPKSGLRRWVGSRYGKLVGYTQK